NEFIHMTEREYKDGEFRPGRCTFHIYCTVCDSLVFICDNTEKCANKHLSECISKIELRRIVYVRSILLKRKIKKRLSPDEIGKLYGVYLSHKKSYECTASNTPEGQKFMKIMNPEMQEEYAKACDEFYVYFRKYYSKYIEIINPAKFTPPYKEYVYYSLGKWIEAKKHQLRRRLDKAIYGSIPDFLRRFTFELISTISYYEKYYVVLRNGPDTAFMLVR
ncbi:15634_t:CDS:2, partial [Funneliformis mosseae]